MNYYWFVREKILDVIHLISKEFYEKFIVAPHSKKH